MDPYAPLKLDHHWIRLVDEAGTCFLVGWLVGSSHNSVLDCSEATSTFSVASMHFVRAAYRVTVSLKFFVCLFVCLYVRMDGTGRIMFVNERLNIIVGQLPVEATYKVGSGPCSRHHSTSDGVEDVV